MMPFPLTFRRLLLKYFPKLPPAALDRHESLFAYRLQLQHEKGIAPPDVDIKKQPPDPSQSVQQHIDDTIRRVNEESAKIWKENGISKADFDRVHELWVKRREFALQQRRFFQFPLSGKYLKAWKDYRTAQAKALPVYVKNHLFPTLALLLLVLILLAGFLFMDACPSEQIPERLQKAISAAKTDAERQAIAQKLEGYYLTMCIPDSIEQRVRAAVEETIARPPDGIKWQKTPPDTNVYQLENQLQELLRDALIARARGDEEVSQKLMGLAQDWGRRVDRATDNDYWVKWIAGAAAFDARQAHTWLRAKQSAHFCSQFHQRDFRAGEQFGALGLQLLKNTPDERLRLDIMQRLITVLYHSYGFFDLTSPLALRALARADSVKYHLRATGIAYHYANALFFAGNNQQALQEFHKVVQRVAQKKQVPWIHWYEVQGLLGIAMANGELGNSEKAIKICNDIAQHSLSYQQELDLRNIRGINFRKLGKYDLARNEFREFLNLAERQKDVTSQILALNNLGFMYYLLSDYEQANSHIARALALQETSQVQDTELKSLVLLNLAETLAELGQIEQFNRIIRLANRLIEHLNIPRRKAHFLASLGSINMKLKKFADAVNDFSKAIFIYQQAGLNRLALEKRVQLTKCLLQLSRFDEAEAQIATLYEWGKTKHDRQAEIEALGLLAQTLYRKGRKSDAILQADRLIRTVESISSEIADEELLAIFRQKSYPYLHEAVRYELGRGQIDSAFIKLDILKGRIFKNRLSRPSFLHSVDIDTLASRMKPGELLVDYFVTEDRLYIFALTPRGLALYEKPISLKRLERLVNDFVSAIEKTNEILSVPAFEKYEAHYARISACSDSLYQILLGWPALARELETTEVAYIVPDNVLYKLPFTCLKKKGENFFVEQTAVIYLPAAIFLQEVWRKSADFSQKRMLISIDPQFAGAEDLRKFLKEQFTNIEEIVLDSPRITREAILEKLNGRYDVYVFVGHGDANEINSNLSTFHFTAFRQSDQADTTVEITLAELKKHVDWSSAEAVFLIGCETGKGPLYSGTGPVGIQQGLLSEGVGMVVASSWKIDAFHAIPQTIALMKRWCQERSLPRALQKVQAETIASYQNHSYYKAPHPYIWAGLAINQTVHN